MEYTKGKMSKGRTEVYIVPPVFVFNKCIHRESFRTGRGLYIGLNDWQDFQWFPWLRDDGDKGFFEWGWFRCGWYPLQADRISDLRRMSDVSRS